MILLHLDTNALIAILNPHGAIYQEVRRHCEKGAIPAASSIAWHEFVRGPIIADELLLIERIVGKQVRPVNRSTAELAARLFNATGRRRGSTADCLIAASAIEDKALFITSNKDDFEPFIAWGLSLL